MIKKVGIIGCGQMGSGIAQVAAHADYRVIGNEVSEELFQKGLHRITRLLDRAIEKGKLDSPTREKILGNITGSTDFADLADCDLVIEAATEDMTTKKEIFAELDKICKPEVIFASNTSSLSIGDLASVTGRRDKFVGLHFFNPVPVMRLVEIVRTIDSSDETVAAAREFAESLGKTVVMAKDSPGFIVNVLLIPYLLDSIRQYERGLATRDDIDNAMKLGCGHPMGPLTLADFIGLDTTLFIADIMFDQFRDSHYAAPPLLRRMVNAGYLGKKSGRGFYDYNK
ncbi:MAG: 3-hydroxybutyryl-CoA dehydrogenase [Candidatus Zixiibacteriota bacterium]|nr:MAG: 3-hydroxybutyryl-CoA dehydrogenase [candidate division Zixibacteria bacterium]